MFFSVFLTFYIHSTFHSFFQLTFQLNINRVFTIVLHKVILYIASQLPLPHIYKLMNIDQVIHSVQSINIQREERIAELTRNANLSVSDDVVVEDPIITGFIERGNEALMTMMNLTI